MAANRRLPMEFYAPRGQENTVELPHRSVGHPVAPDHTLAHNAYPDRRVRSTVFPTNRPMWTTIYADGRKRILSKYKVPTGKIFTSPSSSVPQGRDMFVLNRRVYIYGGQVVTE